MRPNTPVAHGVSRRLLIYTRCVQHLLRLVMPQIGVCFQVYIRSPPSLYPYLRLCARLCVKHHRVLSFGFTRSCRRDIAPSPLIPDDDTGCCKAEYARGNNIRRKILPALLLTCKGAVLGRTKLARAREYDKRLNLEDARKHEEIEFIRWRIKKNAGHRSITVETSTVWSRWTRCETNLSRYTFC